MFKEGAGKKLCNRYDVDYLLAVKNDFDLTNHFESIEFVLKDCKKNTYVRRDYDIYNKEGDIFYYEKDIHASTIKFFTEYFQEW